MDLVCALYLSRFRSICMSEREIVLCVIVAILAICFIVADIIYLIRRASKGVRKKNEQRQKNEDELTKYEAMYNEYQE